MELVLHNYFDRNYESITDHTGAHTHSYIHIYAVESEWARRCTALDDTSRVPERQMKSKAHFSNSLCHNNYSYDYTKTNVAEAIDPILSWTKLDLEREKPYYNYPLTKLSIITITSYTQPERMPERYSTCNSLAN